MTVRVFIQNEAGSDRKNYHDEKLLIWQRAVTVSRPYPFPYGFILDTTADDGCNVDCFILTNATLRTGQIIDCEVVGLMEQFEDGHADHNVLARLPGADVQVDETTQGRLAAFVAGVFAHIPGNRYGPDGFWTPARLTCTLVNIPTNDGRDCTRIPGTAPPMGGRAARDPGSSAGGLQRQRRGSRRLGRGSHSSR